MKIIKQTPLELTLQDYPALTTIAFSLVGFSLFSGVPLLIILTSFFNLGVTTLTCKRVEPIPISCEIQQSRFFGLVQEPPRIFNQVIRAKFHSEETVDSEDNSIVKNSVTLLNNTEEISFIEDSFHNNDHDEMLAITTQINKFIYSQQPILNIQSDTRRNLGKALFLSIFFGIFVVVGFSCLVSAFQYRYLIFDKNSNSFVYKQWTLLGKKSQEYPLYEITGTHIKKTTDSDGDPWYKLALLPKFIYIMSNSNLTEVEKIQKVIEDFLT